MKKIPANFHKPKIVNKCLCNMKEDMAHIYYCELLNIFRIVERNFKRRQILMHEEECKKQIPCDPMLIHCS